MKVLCSKENKEDYIHLIHSENQAWHLYKLHVSGKFSTELGLNKSFVYLVHPKAGLQLSKTTTFEDDSHILISESGLLHVPVGIFLLK